MVSQLHTVSPQDSYRVMDYGGQIDIYGFIGIAGRRVGWKKEQEGIEEEADKVKSHLKRSMET